MAPPTVNLTLTRDLVLSILPPLRDDPTTLRQVTDHIAREVKADVQGSSRMTWPEVESSVASLSRTARVRVQSDVADALDKAVRVLDDHRRRGEAAWEGEMPIKMSNLSQHVQFLLAMARQPTTKTHDLAHDFLHRVTTQAVDKDQMLYNEIMSEPFEGDHWGPGYDSEVREGWTDSDSASESESAGTDEIVVTPHRIRPNLTTYGPVSGPAATPDQEDRVDCAAQRLRDLRENAYWRSDSGENTVPPIKIGDGWRAVSTGLSVASLAAALPDIETPSSTKVISARQFQRELLFALSGRPGVMLSFDGHGDCFVVSNHPTVRHYSPLAVSSILDSYCARATQCSLLRRFIATTLSPVGSSTSHRSIKTAQAFAEACRGFMSSIDQWVADLELVFVRGTQDGLQISTPLSLRSDFDSRFGTMLEHLSSVGHCADEPIHLLNSIHALYQSTNQESKSAMLKIFMSTAAPLWGTLGAWMTKGMPLPRSLIDIESLSESEKTLDPEFWVSRDQDVSWSDEDFWDAAFVFRESLPDWIKPEVLEATLEAGKANGLLRGLLGSEIDEDRDPEWMSLGNLLSERCADGDVSEAIGSFLSARCQLTTVHLRRVLDEECGLQAHLEAIDGIFYLRGIEVLQPWFEWLFEQVMCRKRWTDFQVLTGNLRETVEKQNQLWLNPQAIRIHASRRRTAESAIAPTVLGNVQAAYRVPFPLSQLFTSTSLDLRADVFSFLLQIHFAKYILDRSRLSATSAHDKDNGRLIRLRHKLVWIVNTIWIWLTERVIELETERYKARLDETSSFGAMIQLELHHTRRMRDFSFQHPKTSSINDCLSSIFDLVAEIHDLCVIQQQVQPKPESPVQPNDQYVQGRSRRRMKRIRRRQADIDSSSDEDGDDGEEAVADRTLRADASLANISVKDRVSELDIQLDECVNTIIEGVEGLARSEGPGDDQAEVWGMLAFALQDR